jgi:hypothetical protein
VTKVASTWGELAYERDTLIDAILSFNKFKDALNKFENTSYRGDALKALNKARAEADKAMIVANQIIDKYRR